MAVLTSTFYLNYDNDQALQLWEGGANLTLDQYDAITRITITLQVTGGGTIVLDSDVTTGLMAWGTGTGQELRIEGSKIDDASVTVGVYPARLVAYSPDQPTGIVWIDYTEYQIVVRA